LYPINRVEVKNVVGIRLLVMASMRATQALSQLSYSPNQINLVKYLGKLVTNFDYFNAMQSFSHSIGVK
jgi:hypothetical protein